MIPRVVDKRIAVLIIVLFIFVFWWDDIRTAIVGESTAQKDAEYESQLKMYAICQQDSDCTALYGKCGNWEAVNVVYTEKAKSYFKFVNSEANCRLDNQPRPCKLRCKEGSCSVGEDQAGCPEEYYFE